MPSHSLSSPARPDLSKTSTPTGLPPYSPSSAAVTPTAATSSSTTSSYYDTLDAAATHDVTQVLFPSSCRNSLEIPFLFFGDLHPYLFTHFLRSLIQEANSDTGYRKNKTPVIMTLCHFAFLDPTEEFMTRIGQIETGMRLLLPPLVSRARNAQAAFVELAMMMVTKVVGMSGGGGGGGGDGEGEEEATRLTPNSLKCVNSVSFFLKLTKKHSF